MLVQRTLPILRKRKKTGIYNETQLARSNNCFMAIDYYPTPTVVVVVGGSCAHIWPKSATIRSPKPFQTCPSLKLGVLQGGWGGGGSVPDLGWLGGLTQKRDLRE